MDNDDKSQTGNNPALQNAAFTTNPPPIPDAPATAAPPAVVIPRAPADSNGLIDTMAKVADAMNNSPVIPVLELPYELRLDVPLKRDKDDQHFNTSLDSAGLTDAFANPNKHHGLEYNWGVALTAAQTTGIGPLQPAEPTRNYGAEGEAHMTGQYGTFSFKGGARVFGGEERFRAYMDKGQINAQLQGDGVPACEIPQATEALLASLPTTNQPLISGTASVYGGFDPRHTYIKNGPVELGLTNIGAGGDINYASIHHGRQEETCATVFKLGESLAANFCEVGGVAGGHDYFHVPTGPQGSVSVDMNNLPHDMGELFKKFHHHGGDDNTPPASGSGLAPAPKKRSGGIDNR